MDNKRTLYVDPASVPAPRVPGRVYDVKPDVSKGELPPNRTGHKLRVEWLRNEWRSLPFVTRIEFDDDTDNGIATVEAIFTINNEPKLAPRFSEEEPLIPAKVRFREHVRLVYTKIEEPADEPVLVGGQ